MARKRMTMSPTVSSSKTLAEGFDLFVREKEIQNMRPGTIKHYKDSYKQIIKRLPEETVIKTITEDIWDEFRLALVSDPKLSDTSVYTYSRDLKTMLRFFMSMEWMDTFSLELSKVDKTVIDTYTDDELDKLLKRPNTKKCSFSEYKNWVIINFLLSTGVRQNSLINIKIRDIDFDNSMVNIRVTKNRKPLIIPLNQDIMKILKDYLTIRGKEDMEDYLFCNEYGDRLTKSTLYHGLYDYHKRRGVDKTGIHRYRHTFAKKWVLYGGNVVTLQKVLGHSSLDITQNYINVLTSEVAKDVEEFNILKQFKKKHIKMK